MERYFVKHTTFFRGKIKRVLALIMITVMMFSMNSVSVLASGTDSSEDIAQDNLKLWLKADDGVTESNGVVSSWKNQVDSSEFLPVNDTAGVTLNADGETGYKYLKFDGTEALKGIAGNYNDKEEITIIVVGEYEGTDPRKDSYADVNTALFWEESGDWGSMSLAPFKEQVLMRFGVGSSAGVSRYNRVETAELSVSTAIKNKGTHTLLVDGEEVLSETGKREKTSGISENMYIGRGKSAGQYSYFTGKIAEVLVYDRALSAEESEKVHKYLLEKYNIVVKEPETNSIISADAGEFSVPKGTAADKLVLPFNIDVTLEKEFSNITQPTPSNKTKVSVNWDTSGFDPNLLDQPQTITGELDISLGKSTRDGVTKTIVPVTNPNQVKAQIQVTVRDVQREVYVSPTAAKGGDGSKAAPFQSIQDAKSAIVKNEWNKDMTGDLLVWLAGGEYSVKEPIQFGTKDSGSNGYSIIYQAVPGEVPNINGGTKVENWKKWDKNPEVYVTDLDRDIKLRNLFVDGQEAKLTSTSGNTCGPYGSVTISGDEAWALDGGTETAGVLLKWDELGFTVDQPEKLTNPEDIEIVQKKIWNVVTIGLSEIKSVSPGDDGGAPPAKAVNINTDPSKEQRNREALDAIAEKYAGRQQEGDTAFVLQQPYGAIAACLAWQCNFEPYFGYVNFVGDPIENAEYKTFEIRNSLELLKNPGEFYFDRAAKKLYYYPEPDKDIFESEIVVPQSEGLIRIKGNSSSDRVQNLQFSGIKFTYDDKGLEVVEQSEGFASVQNMAAYTKYISNGDWHSWLYNNTDIPKGTVDVENASGIVFSGNVFTTLSSGTCIGYINDVVNSEISGNVFMNTAGNAATIGHTQHVHIGEEGPPETTKDNKYPVGIEGVCKNIIVTNNYIENTCTMFTQADALTALFVENVEFSHNRITNVPYSGINFGWGWQNQDDRQEFSGTHYPDYPSKTARKNTIVYNDIDKTNQVLPKDGGALYLLGQQEDSVLAYNNVHGVRSIYTDEGTAYFELYYNDIDARNQNRSYDELWYGNNSWNASHSFVTKRGDASTGWRQWEEDVPSINESNLKKPENIPAGAGIEPEWMDGIEELQKQVKATGKNRTEEPKDLEEYAAVDLEDKPIGEVAQEDTQLGTFKYGGAYVEEEDGNKVLRVHAVDGESRHHGFYLKDVEYSEAVIEMDLKYNTDHNFTHDWESVSIQGFASTKGGEEQLSQKESLFAGSYLNESNQHTYHFNTGEEGVHMNGNSVNQKIDKNVWYHVKIMILRGDYFVKLWDKNGREPLEWQLYQELPKELGSNGTLRIATYKNNADSVIDVSFDNIVVSVPAVKTYEVRYDANGGSSAPEKQEKVHGNDLILTEEQPVRKGYIFEGWNTSADGSGTDYQAGAAYSANEAVTLFAKWRAIPAVSPKLTGSVNNTTMTVEVDNPSSEYTYSYEWHLSTIDGEKVGSSSATYTAPEPEADEKTNYVVKVTAVRKDNGKAAFGMYTFTLTGEPKPPVDKPPVEKPPVEKPPVDKPPVEKPVLGKTYTVGNYRYKVTSISKAQVSVTGIVKKTAKSIVVKDTVKIKGQNFKITAIGNNAFKKCKAKTASIGKNVTSIGKTAFYSCKALTSVMIKAKYLKKIDKQAFANCGKLKKVTIKSMYLKSVGKNAFTGVHKKVVFKVPKKKVTAYKKILKKGNPPKTMVVKK